LEEDDSETLASLKKLHSTQAGNYTSKAPADNKPKKTEEKKSLLSEIKKDNAAEDNGDIFDKELINSTKGKQKGSKSKAKGNKGSLEHGGQKGSEDPTDDKDDDKDFDEKNLANKRNRLEEYFMKRIKSQPRQVLRYAFQGQPLWISSPPPVNQIPTIPVCGICGSAKTFECQLMPALLSLVQSTTSHGSKLAPSSKPSNTIGSETAATSLYTQDGDANLADDNHDKAPDTIAVDKETLLQEKLGDSLDYGVVAVWSCPNSCVSSQSRLCQESVIVQPPPDFL
jgi:hypothetical protein